MYSFKYLSHSEASEEITQALPSVGRVRGEDEEFVVLELITFGIFENFRREI